MERAVLARGQRAARGAVAQEPRAGAEGRALRAEPEERAEVAAGESR